MQNKRRREEFVEMKKQSISWLESMGLEVPSNPAELKIIANHLGEYLASVNFLTKNPGWVKSLPIIAGHDDKEQMRWRATFDERLTFPIDALPMTVLEFLDAGQGKWAIADCFYRCTGRVGRYAAASGADTSDNSAPPVYIEGKAVWTETECGLVMSAESQWDHTMLSLSLIHI